MAGKQTTAAAKKAAAAKQEATVTANAVQDKEVVNESGQPATDAAASDDSAQDKETTSEPGQSAMDAAGGDDSAQDKETTNEPAQPVTAAGDESGQDETTALSPLEGPVDGLWIKSVSPRGRRRAGLHFTQDATGVALCALSDDDIAAIKADPMLVVEEMTFTGDDAAEILRGAGAE